MSKRSPGWSVGIYITPVGRSLDQTVDMDMSHPFFLQSSRMVGNRCFRVRSFEISYREYLILTSSTKFLIEEVIPQSDVFHQQQMFTCLKIRRKVSSPNRDLPWQKVIQQFRAKPCQKHLCFSKIQAPQQKCRAVFFKNHQTPIAGPTKQKIGLDMAMLMSFHFYKIQPPSQNQVSSCAISIDSVTSAKTVGSKNCPWQPHMLC